MSSSNPDDVAATTEATKKSALHYAKAWGENPIPPAGLSALIAAQHMRPFQLTPMLFPPVFLFTSYLNVFGFKIDAAGLSSAWAGLYMLLASRRQQPFMQKLGVRGAFRGVTMGLCLAQVVGGGVVWAFGNRDKEKVVRLEKAKEREERVKRESGGG
ncbi:MAG: hypothetical protein Q9160_006204 [Pyrenula sp. 1 TL-2023]